MGRKRPHRGNRRRGFGSAHRKPKVFLDGTIRVFGRGVAEVSTSEGTFPVARGGIREAMSGDEVQVSISSRGGEKRAYVQGVITRATESFLGTYEWIDPLGAVSPLDARIRRDFFVVPQDDSARKRGVRTGDVVVARIMEYPSRRSAGVVTIDRRVGSADELDLNVEAVIASNDLVTEFPAAALEEAAAVRVDADEALVRDRLRRDLRSSCAVTIDPADARDFDDAVCAREVDDGFEVEVHIADVSHYVAWNSAIDNEAKRRTCSVYLVDRVIPMLPEALSCDACSLRPGEDRLTMSVVMRLSKRGEVVGGSAAPAVIRSRGRLDYDAVDALLAGDVDASGLAVEESSRLEVMTSLRLLDKIARLREGIRHRRGAIDFETREAKVVLDEKGAPTGVRVRRKTRATSLVEEAMLMANEFVAGVLGDADVPAAYRVHEPPAHDDLVSTIPILEELELTDPKTLAGLVAGEPEAIRTVLERARGTAGEYLANSVLLRAQRRAIYLPHNEGHYALGARAYCHFTSPIRRYPDVLVHRALRAKLEGKLDSRDQAQAKKLLPQLCRTCSDQERVADRAARQSQKVKMAQMYADRVGESFSGVVTGCTRHGLFVMLDESCAEGMIPVRDLGDEWFWYDERRLCLVGEETGREWRPGKRVAVTVVSAEPSRGQIDFVLAGHVRESSRA